MFLMFLPLSSLKQSKTYKKTYIPWHSCLETLLNPSSIRCAPNQSGKFQDLTVTYSGATYHTASLSVLCLMFLDVEKLTSSINTLSQSRIKQFEGRGW